MFKEKINSELKNFYLFLMGQFVSQFGSRLTSYGLILWAYKQSGSVLSLSLLSICYLVPEVFLSFISGTISDRWNKKIIMLVADTISAVFSLSIFIMLLTGNLKVSYLYIINFMMGVMDSFQNPAFEVSVSAMVAKDDYIKTSGIRTFCNSFIGVLAPFVATSLYAILGMECIVLIDLATFVFAFVTLAFVVRVPHISNKDAEAQSLLEQCKFGIRYLINKKGILNLIMFMAFVNLIAAIYNVNLAPMVLSRNGNNDIQLGIVSSTVSIGGILGSILVSKMPQTKKRVPLILNIMSFSFLFCNGLLGIGRNYYVWTLAVFGGNILIPFLTANVEYIMRTKVPLEQQGRVFSARNTLQFASIPIGNLLGGFFADKVFTPFMSNPNDVPAFFSILVGKGEGSGIGLLYVCIALGGLLGCCLFRGNKNLLSLDHEETVV
jgi:hypothetical protein